MLFCGHPSIPLRASPVIKTLSKQHSFPLPHTNLRTPIPLPRSQGQLRGTRKFRPCLQSPESLLTQGGWSLPCLAVGLCFAMSRGPQKSSFFFYHSHHDARPSSLRRAKTGQRPKLWCTRNGLNGGRRPHRVAQQVVHP